jgi:DnaJ-domain-containing protein 1
MKSALELAMERADATLGDDYVELKDEQKAAIEEIKKQYQAKWAEQEIALKGKIDKIAAEVEPPVLAEHQSQFQAEMGRVRQQIFAERDAKIEEIRQQS